MEKRALAKRRRFALGFTGGGVSVACGGNHRLPHEDGGATVTHGKKNPDPGETYTVRKLIT